tara:strand:+ start:323 stop:598 length:276 start_codon:yes stop_codon:yes gene_type:complete
MLSYFVIGLCIFLLLVVIFISAKPISMGIEARRDLKDKALTENRDDEDIDFSRNYKQDNNISDELLKLNKLKVDGILSNDEYEKAKKKILD